MMSGADTLYFIILGLPVAVLAVITGLCLGFSTGIAKGSKLMLALGLVMTLGMVLASVYLVFYVNSQTGAGDQPPLPGGTTSWIIGYVIVMAIATWGVRHLMHGNRSQEVG